MFIELVFCRRSICLSMALSMFLSNWGPVLEDFCILAVLMVQGEPVSHLFPSSCWLGTSPTTAFMFLNRPISSHLCKSFFISSTLEWTFSKFDPSVTGVERSGSRLLSQLPYNFLQRGASLCTKGLLCRTFS